MTDAETQLYDDLTALGIGYAVYEHPAVFTVEDGNDKVVYRQAIPYTDFDFSGGDVFTLWAVMGEARTVMLPSEY